MAQEPHAPWSRWDAPGTLFYKKIYFFLDFQHYYIYIFDNTTKLIFKVLLNNKKDVFFILDVRSISSLHDNYNYKFVKKPVPTSVIDKPQFADLNTFPNGISLPFVYSDQSSSTSPGFIPATLVSKKYNGENFIIIQIKMF